MDLLTRNSLPERAFDVREAALEVSQLQIEYVELYPQAVVVRWRDAARSAWPEPEPPIALASYRAREILIRDDVGTKYAVCGGGSASDQFEELGEVVFSPAPPENAKYLIVGGKAGQTVAVRVEQPGR